MADSDDFSVLVLASDARPFLLQDDKERVSEVAEERENWHDCPSYFDEDFSDLELLRFIQPRLLVLRGLRSMLSSRFSLRCQKGLIAFSICTRPCKRKIILLLRWIYEDLPSEVKERLQTVYFLHPGLRSRLAFATLGRFFLSGNLYWKIKYVSRLQYLWEDINKGEVETPEFVQKHDDILEHRPLTDYGIEPYPLPLSGVPPPSYVFGRHGDRWAAREYIS